jgi:hypothetical protein
MSQEKATDPVSPLDASESPNQTLERLAELARQAYERKDSVECLQLTREMLVIDPGSPFAQSMRASIEVNMQRDLEEARAFLRQASEKGTPSIEKKDESPAAPAAPIDVGMSESVPAAPLTAAISPDGSQTGRQWLVGVGLALVSGLAVFGVFRLMTEFNPTEASRVNSATPAVLAPPPNLIANSVGLQPRAVPAGSPVLNMGPAAPMQVEPVRVPPPPPPTATSPVPEPPRTDVSASNGTLALSSPTTVDIYKDDAYLGSLPVSLELPAGMHTLEYRHGNLRQIGTHVVKSSEITRSRITFDVNVQINSRPWATVFLDGVERKSLGQTPLSGVLVPIGGVLVFENPQFPEKRYRVTGNETGIQVVFP